MSHSYLPNGEAPWPNHNTQGLVLRHVGRISSMNICRMTGNLTRVAKPLTPPTSQGRSFDVPASFLFHQIVGHCFSLSYNEIHYSFAVSLVNQATVLSTYHLLNWELVYREKHSRHLLHCGRRALTTLSPLFGSQRDWDLLMCGWAVAERKTMSPTCKKVFKYGSKSPLYPINPNLTVLNKILATAA